MSAAPRDREATAIALLVDAHLSGPTEWGPEHHAVAESAARIAAEWVRRDGRATRSDTPGKPTKNRPNQRARARDKRRTEVREQRLTLNPTCEAPGRGMPGPCESFNLERPLLEVHEIVGRGRAPGAHFVLEVTATLCQAHHDAVTSASGEASELAESCGLVLPASAVTFVDGGPMFGRLPQLRDEWKWARP